MHLRKFRVYIAFTFAVFSAFDSLPVLGATPDCHPRIRDAYFSTLLQTDKQWLCNICEIGAMNNGFIISMETIPSGRYPRIYIFGTKPVKPFLREPWQKSPFGWHFESWIMKGPPNPLVTALLVPCKSDMKDFWVRARLARWQAEQSLTFGRRKSSN